ncbi:cupredoxin domain-containing protein [Actinocrispum wychmicini]|uniref:Putative cupredoxin-like copper-binding protein n=1 Tax=Actinocrispum wychmicini TaxID=1213861 RepID=A0A4V2S4M2_9PSEU|nr:cupredoxin domain-containing protein [Actinocrispum wychmicini]TCO48810.1 putative cupredoxin-like copper-binding protein [Actinocrispum wychmicini]
MRRVGLTFTAVTLLLAGCDTNTPSPPPGPRPVLGSGTKVTATLTDFHVELSQQSFRAGTYTFDVRNTGKVTHSLEIVREDQTDTRSDNIQPGHSDQITVALTPGKYQVFCPVGNHRSQGMDMDITVTS